MRRDLHNHTKYSDGVIGIVHIAKTIQKKYSLSWQEIFNKYIGNNAPCLVPVENLDLKEAITLLHDNNAIAVLAHPHHILKNNIEELIKLDIDGLENYYPTLNYSIREKLIDLKNKYNLIATGGSDFHFHQTGIDELYPYGIEKEYAKIFLKRLEL